jgi:hypothetical protein
LSLCYVCVRHAANRQLHVPQWHALSADLVHKKKQSRPRAREGGHRGQKKKAARGHVESVCSAAVSAPPPCPTRSRLPHASARVSKVRTGCCANLRVRLTGPAQARSTTAGCASCTATTAGPRTLPCPTRATPTRSLSFRTWLAAMRARQSRADGRVLHRFTSCYDEHATQDAIFDRDVHPLVDTVYSGVVRPDSLSPTSP